MTQNTKKSQIIKKLAEQAKDIKKSSLNTLFKNDPTRAQKHSLKINDIYCDYSKNHIDQDIFENLINWAKSCDLSQKTKDFLSGKHINNTEDRAVLHPALRCVPNKKLLDIIPKDIQTEVSSEYSKMQKFVSKIHNGDFIGSTGEKITTIVNIGIGGSDLGPKMIVNALRP